MARKPKTYRKLAGSEFSVLFKHSLWQGPDHLLWVERAVFQEHYRRFYFKDIEALVLMRTGRRTAWSLVLGAFFLLFAAIVVFSEETAYFSVFTAGLLAVLLVVQWLRGPGCEVYLQTAVQQYKISNLVRSLKAIKVMNQIRSEVDAVQAPLTEQAVADVGRSGIPETADETAEIRSAGTDAKAAGSYRLRVHWILYGILLFFGLARAAQLWLKSMPLAAADMVFLACTIVLAIVAVARPYGRRSGTLLSLSAWLTLVFSLAHAATAYGIFIAASMRPRESIYDDWGALKNFFSLLTGSQPIVEAIAVGVALVSIALGILGLVAVLMEKRVHPKRMRGQPK